MMDVTCHRFRARPSVLALMFHILAVIVLCSACAPKLEQRGNMDIKASVYVQPEHPLPLFTKRLLIAPVDLYSPKAREWIPTVTTIVQDILSQERVFKVIVQGKKKFDSPESLLENARQQGFDYVLFGSVPPVIFPSGNTSGWIGFDMKIVNTNSQVTIWHIYGQAALVPAPTRWSIMGDASYAPAPSLSQGFTAILHRMACIIKCQALGPSCSHTPYHRVP